MLLEKFLKTVELRGRSSNTIEHLNQTVVKAEKWLNKPLEEATYEEIQSFIEFSKENGLSFDGEKGRGLSKSSIWSLESKLIQFYTFCFNDTDDAKYHKMVKQIKNIKVDKPKNDLQPKDILAPEEVKKLINVATIERDRCLVASIYEPGMRIGEILALNNDMVQLNETNQEVIFNIPNTDDTEDNDPKAKTGARSVLCLEIYGYVQDWMKCNNSTKFMPLSANGIRVVLRKLFRKAGINKPNNPHNLRHSSITNACIMKMQPNQISMRYWGIPNSNMLSVYLHLSDQIVNSGYRDAKGMGNGNGATVINPLAVRCVNCGKLIQSGSLCKICEDNKKISDKNIELEKQVKQLMTAIKNFNIISESMDEQGVDKKGLKISKIGKLNFEQKTS